VRATLLIVVVLLTATAWILTYSQVHAMGFLMQVGVPMSLGMEGRAGFASFFVFTGMWLVMMVAMMLPSSYPTLQLHRTVYRKRTPGAWGGTFLFALSYFLVWTATGAFFYAAYVLIGKLRASLPGAEPLVLRAAGAVLIVSGLYQWSRLKQACLKHCQNPLHFVMEHWHDGRFGALRMGAAHGVYCFGCCWGLMMILFVMGIMNLGWMAAIGALILLEKVAPTGKWLSRTIGAVFVGIGLIVVFFPGVLHQLSSHVILASK
jgi:predicted metal-binding membrane protein